ncbi:MAG TPA: PRC-barrel domain-containing protein, partial [Hyphomicrobium sp.]|nr:PRC-barrel domain-containing protein [Hyphomicrobium sp.]
RADTTSPPAQQAPATPEAQSTAPAVPAEATGKDKAEEQPGSDTPAVVVDDNKVESLLGKEVTSAKGEKLGQITDILVSHAGEIRAAVIDFGGFLGVGSRKIAVAWRTLKFSPNAITLGMTRDELRVTPEYHQGEPIVIVGAAAQSLPTPATPPPQSQPGAAPANPAPTK